MNRFVLLTLAVTFLSFYAFRDWYRSLCGVIVMMAFVERSDMPRQMFGVTGMNAWNLLIAVTLIGWFFSRHKEKLVWDMPKHINILLFLYILVITIGFTRMIGNMDSVAELYATNNSAVVTFKTLFLNEYLNTIKYVIPGLLLFHGCNSRSRLMWGIGACLLATLFLGLQIISRMPLEGLSDGAALSDRALRVLNRSIGYHRVDLAVMMASGSWAFFAARELASKQIWRWALLSAGLLLILSLALTGGRTGYVTWVALAMLLSFLKWKKLLLVLPILIATILLIVPAARERMLQGIVKSDEFVSYEQAGLDLEMITSDRILIWPVAVNKIGEAPFLGYGRKGFVISGALREVKELHGNRGRVAHPHNAYLELLIDNGLIGSVPILIFFFIVARRSWRLLRNKESPNHFVIGGIAMAFVAGQLIASMGAQSFYPGSGVVLMWCTIGLMLRVSVNWDLARNPGRPISAPC